MKKYCRAGVVSIWAVVGVWCASAQPKVSTAALTFSYQVNATVIPAAQLVQVTVPTTLAGYPVTVAIVSEAGVSVNDWLTVTQSSGYAPLTLTVNVNPTGMTPGGYTEKITVTSSLMPTNPAIVKVRLSVSNPSSSLMVTSPTASPTYTNPPPLLTFNYNTSGTGAVAAAAIAAITAELDVASSSGDTIPFTVTASVAKGSSGNWLRVNGATTTSGVALVGSLIPFTVTVDATTVESLLPGPYSGVIAFVATNNANLTATVAVSLIVSAGPPSISAFYPTTIIASPVVDPVITIYGDNFFDGSSVSLQQYTGSGGTAVLGQLVTLPNTALTKLSQQVLRVVIPASTFTAMGTWQVIVMNPIPPTNPAQQPAVCPYLAAATDPSPATNCSLTFTVTSATTSTIAAVLNSASFSATANQTGSHVDPIGAGKFAVAPREIVSIFGQNFGPAAVTQVAPVTAGGITRFPTTWTDPTVTAPTVGATVTVAFTITYPVGAGYTTIQRDAPLIMVSANQINAIVPKDVAYALTSGEPTATASVSITVSYRPGYTGTVATTTNTSAFLVTPVGSDPGLFTFDGLGKGQSAVLNYLTSGALVVNSTKNSAAKGSIIEIYATGLGELTVPLTGDGVIPPSTSAGAIPVVGPVRVDIGGQPAVVTYAGTAPGMVAGLVQINALVPPTVTAGTAVTITTSVGDTVTARTSQGQVTINVK